jgi:hypothetical protein
MSVLKNQRLFPKPSSNYALEEQMINGFQFIREDTMQGFSTIYFPRLLPNLNSNCACEEQMINGLEFII